MVSHHLLSSSILVICLPFVRGGVHLISGLSALRVSLPCFQFVEIVSKIPKPRTVCLDWLNLLSMTWSATWDRNCVVECVLIMRVDKQKEALFTLLGWRCFSQHPHSFLLPWQTDWVILLLHLLLVVLRTFISRCLFFSIPRGRRQRLRKWEKVVKYKVQSTSNYLIVTGRHLKGAGSCPMSKRSKVDSHK